MTENKNITYLLGAGASYQACPVLKELGEKMVELARSFFKDPTYHFYQMADSTQLKENEKLIWNIGYFGSKAIKYGTIDTYAKKLYLNNSLGELESLKLAVSSFFTIWQLTENDSLKSRDGKVLDDIDRRYISLMASIIKNKENGRNEIKHNIKFVTWNYDLQLEFAFKSFCYDYLTWDNITNDLRFRIAGDTTIDLDICHLNGYSGFYKTNKNKECHIFDRTDSTNIDDVINNLSFTYESQKRGTIDFTSHINYAWENNSLAESARKIAKKIFSETDILIIVGYSFPNFNKEIDKTIFNELREKNTKIFYQDPNASSVFIKNLIGNKQCEIECENKKIDNFILPYEF